MIAAVSYTHLDVYKRQKLHYFPAVSREDFEYLGHDHRGRITDMLADGRIPEFLGLEPLDACLLYTSRCV